MFLVKKQNKTTRNNAKNESFSSPHIHMCTKCFVSFSFSPKIMVNTWLTYSSIVVNTWAC